MAHSSQHSGSASIVVGVDGSEHSKTAFEVAHGLAQQRQMALKVVSAYKEPGYEYLPENVQGLAKRNAEEFMDDLLVTVKDTEVPISTASIEGDAAGVLINESRHAALVVVGKRGRSRFAGRFLGSVSASVASHAHCPSLVVPARAKRKDLPEAAFAGLPEELDDTSIGAITSEGVSASADFRDSIVVGIDLDIQPIDLALTAAKYAEARNLNLVLVSAQPFSGSLWMPVSPAYYAQVPDLRKNVADRLAFFAEAIEDQTSAPVQWRFYDANPSDILTEASHTASMIVTGTRGRGGFTGLLLGSVSQAVLNRALCQVLVIPTAPEE